MKDILKGISILPPLLAPSLDSLLIVHPNFLIKIFFLKQSSNNTIFCFKTLIVPLYDYKIKTVEYSLSHWI